MWPFRRAEKRESGGDFADAVVRLIEQTAAGTAADRTATAAVEAAAGALSRAFAAAEVEGPSWAQEAVSGAVRAQIGRDLVRKGDSMHVLRTSGGRLVLIPASSWHWEGSHDPASWTVRVTAYGPSTSTTWNLPASAVVFVRWGSNPGQPYIGTAPTSWASTTARLQAAAESNLADEAGSPLAQLLPMPRDGAAGDGDDDDPMKQILTAIAQARGKALTVPTTADGFGEGAVAAPRADWRQQRLGPMPPDAMVKLADDGFARMLAACGCSPALFDDSDGTAKREALRQWHLGTVEPLAGLVAAELSAKLDTPIRFRFDLYAVDLAGRAQAFQKLVAGGVAVNEALATSGLLADD